MRKFSVSATAIVARPLRLALRLTMCVLPATLAEQSLAMSAFAAALFGLIDGYSRRLWSYSSRSFIANGEGLEISSGSAVLVVSWEHVLAIQTWRRFDGIEWLAVHYTRAGRLFVATCVSRCAEAELSTFVRACATYVSSGAPRQSITIAGLCDQSVYWPLLKRFLADVAATTLVGALFRAVGPAFALGVLAAALSAGISAARHSLRRTRFVQTDGLWHTDGHTLRPLHAIPRTLQLWVQCLAEACSKQTRRTM